ncbi:MAG: hypothetical protein HKN32_01000 [Flavobacteriales bacterium]|nr:hypothetical protein [Flavobacteriales bacterium]
MLKRIWILLLLLPTTMVGQRNVQDSLLKAIHVGFSYGFQLPGGDMSTRFGANGSLGLQLNVKSTENWFYGVDATALIGDNVKEPGLIGNLLTERDEIIDNEGKIADVRIQERGYTVMATGGKLFDVIGPNPNSGILVKGGIGFIQHKIRFEHQFNRITQLEDPYVKGYDRLTNGLALSQFVGYFHMSNNRLANFFVGVEAFEGFTQGRRDINFDTGIVDDQPRFDALVGFRAGWVIHFYQRVGQEFYFN